MTLRKDVSVAVATVVALALLLVFASTASAAGNNACAPGVNQDLLVAFYDGTGSPTPGGEITSLGGAISGGFYGNTSNAGIDSDAPASGKGVTPSISPGPQTTPNPEPGTGSSIGDVINAFCS